MPEELGQHTQKQTGKEYKRFFEGSHNRYILSLGGERVNIFFLPHFYTFSDLISTMAGTGFPP